MTKQKQAEKSPPASVHISPATGALLRHIKETCGINHGRLVDQVMQAWASGRLFQLPRVAP